MSKKSANKKVAPAKPSGTITANKLTSEDDGIQLSVAFSDSLLATTSAFSVFILSQKADTFYENISFGLLAIAATLGVIRFGVLPQISTIHKFFATLAGFSIAILAWGIYTRIDQTIERDARLMAIGVILLIVVIPCTFLGLAKFIEVFQTAVVGLSFVVLCYKAATDLYPQDADTAKLIWTGVGIFIASSTLVGTKGKLFGMKRVDIFHVLLVLGNWCFTTVINRL